MATSRYRIDPKDLKRPDEFVSFADHAVEYLGNHISQVIIGAVAIIAAFLVAFGISFYYQHRNRLEADGFYDALTALNHKDYKTAEAGFSTLSETGSGSLSRLAPLYLASAYYNDGHMAKARDALDSYIAASNHPIFKEMALMQLGAVDENLGDFKAAHQAYSDAAALNGPESHTAQIESARTLARLGDKAGAIAAYRQFLALNPYSEERTDVIEALARLGATPAAPETGALAPQANAALPQPVAASPATVAKSLPAAGNSATAPAAAAPHASPTR